MWKVLRDEMGKIKFLPYNGAKSLGLYDLISNKTKISSSEIYGYIKNKLKKTIDSGKFTLITGDDKVFKKTKFAFNGRNIVMIFNAMCFNSDKHYYPCFVKTCGSVISDDDYNIFRHTQISSCSKRYLVTNGQLTNVKRVSTRSKRYKNANKIMDIRSKIIESRKNNKGTDYCSVCDELSKLLRSRSE